MIDWYEGEDKWHERILVWKGHAEHGWYVLTPDYDLYEQSYSLDGVDGPVKFKIKGRHFTFYSRVNAPVYKFSADPSDADMRGYIETALDELGFDVVPPDGWRPSEVKVARHTVSTSALLGRRFVPRRITRGLGVLETPQEGTGSDFCGLLPELRSQLTGLLDPPSGFVWAAFLPGLPGEVRQALEVTVDDGKGLQFGDGLGVYDHGSLGWIPLQLIKVKDAPELFRQHLGRDVPSGSGDNLLGTNSSAQPTVEAVGATGSDSLDARVLEVDYNAAGERHKDWKQLILEARDYQFSDWPLEGPLSTAHLLRHFEKFGGDPKRWLSEWMRAKQVSETDRVAFEMRTLVDCLYTAGSYDQVNVPALASMEIVARRLQGIVDAYAAGSPGNPDWSSARVITGYRGAEDAIAPALRSWASRRNKEEIDLAVSRARVRDHRRGLQVPVVEEAAAGAVADGALPNSGQKAKARPGRGRGRGLVAPDGQ